MPASFPAPPWADAFTGFELSELSQGRSRKTIATRRSSVLALARRFPQAAPEAVTKRNLQAHFAALQKEHKPGGVVAAYNDLRVFFKWLADDADMPVNPMPSIPRQKVDMPTFPVLSPRQIRALLDTCRGKPS